MSQINNWYKKVEAQNQRQKSTSQIIAHDSAIGQHLL